VIANVMFGVQSVQQTLIDSARVLGASEKDIFFKVLIPAAAPSIINGMRVGLAIGWSCLVGGGDASRQFGWRRLSYHPCRTSWPELIW